MGEAKKRAEEAKLRVLDGGKAPVRAGPPRLVTHTVLIEESDHARIEAERARLGVGSAALFDLMLISGGIGAIEVDGYMAAYQAYAAQAGKLRKSNPSVPEPSAYMFARVVAKAGLAALMAEAKRKAAEIEASPEPGGDKEA